MVGPQRREREIQTAVLALLHARGVLAWKAGSGAFRVTDTHGRERYVKIGHSGVADIIGLMPPSGRMVACEIKRPGKAATLEQANFLASVRQAGGIAFVATCCEDVAREMGWT